MLSAREFLEIGKDHLLHDRFDDAIINFDNAIKLEKTAEAFCELAAAYGKRFEMNRNQTDFLWAAWDLSQAIELEPHVSHIYRQRAELYRSNSREEDAAKDMKVAEMNHAIELDPHNASLYKIKADWLAMYPRYYTEALMAIDQCIKLEPNSIAARHFRATLNQLREEYGMVGHDIVNMEKINPKHELTYEIIFSHHSIIMPYKQQNERLELIQSLTADMLITPEDDTLYVQRGLLYQINNQLDEGLADVNKALALRATSVAYFLRGFIYYSQQRFDEAITDFESSIDALKSYGPTLTLLWAYEYRGMTHDAKHNVYQAACDFSNQRSILKSLTWDLELGRDDETQKYNDLIQLLDKRAALEKSYAIKDIKQFNELTDSINAILQAENSTEIPLNYIKIPQPLVNLVGFFVTQHRQQINQPEGYLISDLSEKLDDGFFLVPAQENRRCIY